MHFTCTLPRKVDILTYTCAYALFYIQTHTYTSARSWTNSKQLWSKQNHSHMRFLHTNTYIYICTCTQLDKSVITHICTFIQTNTYLYICTQLNKFETALVKARMQGLSQYVGGNDKTAAEASRDSLLKAARNLEKAGECLMCVCVCVILCFFCVCVERELAQGCKEIGEGW